MRHTVTFTTAKNHPEIEDLLAELTAAGPFASSGPEATGPCTWTIRLEPRHPGMHTGFASVAEFLLRLSRSVEILSVARADTAGLAVAS